VAAAQEPGKRQMGFYPGTASMGNALHQLSVIAQPQLEYVLEEKLSEDSEEDVGTTTATPSFHSCLPNYFATAA
jgi:hypothetical protein